QPSRTTTFKQRAPGTQAEPQPVPRMLRSQPACPPMSEDGASEEENKRNKTPPIAATMTRCTISEWRIESTRNASPTPEFTTTRSGRFDPHRDRTTSECPNSARLNGALRSPEISPRGDPPTLHILAERRRRNRKKSSHISEPINGCRCRTSFTEPRVL